VVSKIEIKLQQMGIALAESNPPAGNYVRARQTGKLLFVSGHLPDSDGMQRFMGKLGRELTTDQGYQAAGSATVNALGTVKQYLGDLDRVSQFVKLLGMVNSMPDFVEQPQVMNGASDLLHEVFGSEIAPHARSAVGMAVLPRGNSVEIEMIIEVK
jgi:enamine deaminase RidA (YjgF/YER057c/UK114 family)